MSTFPADLPTAAGVEVDTPHRSQLASLRRNSAARFVADGAGMALGILAGVVTARWLGADGKGLFSSITFLAALVMQASSIGLGDAAIVMAGQGKATLQEALSATLATLGLASLAGMLLFSAVAVLAFARDWDAVRTAVIVATLGVPVSLFGYVLGFVLTAQERVVAASVVLVVTSSLTTAGLWLFVAVLDLSVAGAVLATLLGSSAGLVLAASLLRRTRLSLRPRWSTAYVRQAISYGVTVEASYLVTVMFLRVDLLLVYSLAGSGPAGQYSVALTVAALAGLLPIAISHAIFPRLAHVDPEEASDLTARACRLATAAALAAALVLLVATPVIIPLLFGNQFRAAVEPALVMLPGSVFWSAQWLLCRAEAARGRPMLLLVSFGVGLAVMLAGDLALIPAFGTTGAALASVAAPAVGLVICLVAYGRSPQWPLPLTRLVPTPADVRLLLKSIKGLLPGSTSKQTVEGLP